MDPKSKSTTGSPEAASSPSPDNKTNAIHSKLVRLMTVIAYICSVSMAAVMLSLYYVFLWDPASHKSGTPAAFQQSDSAYTSNSNSNSDSPNGGPMIRHLFSEHITAGIVLFCIPIIYPVLITA